jgi:DNA-binding transcriptional ArsR family regulator
VIDRGEVENGQVRKRPTKIHPAMERLEHMAATTTSDDDGADEVYAEGTALTEMLGGGPKVKMLSAFLAEPEYDLNKTEIADMAGVSRNTVYRHLDDLTEMGVVIETRETGGNQRYKINKDNPAAKKLAELEWELIDIVFDENDEG